MDIKMNYQDLHNIKNLPAVKKNMTCIYRLRSLVMGKSYVGSAKKLNVRINNHIHGLKIGSHHNIILQNHVNKYGIHDIVLDVLEIVSIEDIITKEQYYIDLLKPEFNIIKTAWSRIGHKASTETIGKLRASHIGIKQSVESIKKRSESCKIMAANLSEQKKINRKNGGYSRRRKIICLETLQVYKSISETELLTGCDNVWRICSYEKGNSKGLTFRYHES